MEAFSFDESWQLLRRLLPADLEQCARRTGFVRRLRGFSSVEVLTRLLLMHGSGLSLEQTALRGAEQGLGETSAVALHQRLRSSEAFWTELCRHVQASLRPALDEQGRWPQGWKYRAIDATDVTEPGATGSQWRVHYSLRLPELVCDHFELTDYKAAETLRRWKIAAGEVVLADRAYSHRAALAGLMEAGAHFVVRLNTGAFPLEKARAQPVDLLALLKGLAVGRPQAWSLWFRHGSERVPVRLCAVKKNAAAAAHSRQKARRRAQQERLQIQERTLQLAEYVLILTNLPPETWTPSSVLELYRCRWQVELAFKRLKSLLQVGHLPKKDQATARSWMQMKLLLALLTERLLFDAEFVSPWGYDWRQLEPLEGVSGSL